MDAETMFENHIDHLALGGHLLPPDSQNEINAYLLGHVLQTLVKEYDHRGLARARAVLPLAYGAEQMRMMVRKICLAAGAEGYKECNVWPPQDPSRTYKFPDWETSCKTCRRPSAPREVFCACAFPASKATQKLGRNVKALPSLVDEDQLKLWTSGRRPLSIDRYLMALIKLSEQGYFEPYQFDYDMKILSALTGFVPHLRALRKILMKSWPKMQAKDQMLVCTWHGEKPWATFIGTRCQEGLDQRDTIIDPNVFPHLEGSWMFDALANSHRQEVIRLQRLPVLVEVRVTPFPLPIDPPEFKDYPKGMLALRLFIRPAATA